MNTREQKELFKLLDKQINRFVGAGGNTESVEIAEQLLMSMEYCMNSYYKGLEDGEPYGLTNVKKPSAGKKEHMEDIFEKGVVAVKGCVQKSKELWIKVKKTMVDVDNNTYKNTILKEIPEFFQNYQPRFGAQLNPVEIQYPLAIEIEELSGVEYIYEYLYHLWLENTFVAKFDIALVNALIRGYHKEASDYITNLFELVLQNALGLKILGRDVSSLQITMEDRKQLIKELDGFGNARMQVYCENVCQELLEDLQIADEDMIAYTMEKIKEISKRLVNSMKHNNLSYIFVTFGEKKKAEDTYFDGRMLPDMKLREIIDEMCQLRYLKDKLQILKEEVHSLKDLKEVLSECFAGEEYAQVFQLMLPSERELMIHQAKANLAFYGDESMLQEWERMLLELDSACEVE